MAEFEDLVDTPHAKDIKVIIDFAPNHTSFAVYDRQIQPNDGVLYRNGQYVSTYNNDPNGIFNHVMENFANESGMSLLDFRYNTAVRHVVANATTSSYTMINFHNTLMSMEQDYEFINDQVTFLDNHDQSRFMTEANNNAWTLDIASTLQMTSRGIPCIYYGTEQYMEEAPGGTSDPYNRADMIGFNQNTRAYKIISELVPLRKTNLALAYGTTQEK